MRRNDLIKLISNFPEETEFFTIGQGLHEGNYIKDIELRTFEMQLIGLDAIGWAEHYGVQLGDVILCEKN